MGRARKGAKAKKAAPPGGAVGAMVADAASSLGGALQTPETFVEKPADVVSALRGACASFYAAAKVGQSAGQARLFTAGSFTSDQILPQLDSLTDSVCAQVESTLADYTTTSPQKDAKSSEESEGPEGTDDVDGEGAEASLEMEEDEDEDEDEGDEMSLDEEMEDLEEMEEGEEGEESEEEDEEDEEGGALEEEMMKHKGSRINAAKKLLNKIEEDDEIGELEAAYGKKKKGKSRRARGEKPLDSEEELLDRIEAQIGESGTDDSLEAPIGTEKPKKLRKTATDAPAHTGFEGYEGEDEEEEEEEFDADMMAGMQEDTDALKEMYGVGNYDGEDAFGMVGDEAAMEDDQVEQEGAKMRRSAKGEAEEFSSDEEEVELDEDEDFQVDPTSTLTPFQQRQQRLQKRISNIESSRLDETHWTLGGETMASARPENALLGEVLEFDHTQKAKTLITEEITKSLEERLKKRIQESLFDDVVRREKRSSAMDLRIEHQNEIDLHAKSKVGLADLYEKEWLDNHRKELEKAGQSTHELTEEEKEELKVIQMWRNLSSNLDMLSNFYFTPKPMPSDELQIRATQKSAISMEEATPTAVSSETLLAPQDVHAPSKRKFDDRGADELTTRDRKRLRRTIKENHKAKETRKSHQKDQLEQKKSKVKAIKAAQNPE